VALSRDRPEPLLVVHGLGDRALAWRRFAAAMEPGREVVTFDLPGHGDAPPGADYRYPALVEAVGRAAEGYDRFALLGHSIGGAVAWVYAARHPERVTRLVLVEAAAPHRSRFIDCPSPAATHPYTYSSLAEAVEALSAFDPTATEEVVRENYRERPDGRWEPAFDAAIFPMLVDDQRENGRRYWEDLGGIRVPTLVVRAGASFGDAGQLEEIAAAIPGARLLTLDGVGHFLHRERPDQLAQAVGEFLAEPPRAVAG
jgi:pimeloyl-ACP methyl ester carboxylesterase